MGAQYLPDSVGVPALPHGRVVLEGLAGVELAGGVVQVRELHHLEHTLISRAWNEGQTKISKSQRRPPFLHPCPYFMSIYCGVNLHLA